MPPCPTVADWQCACRAATPPLRSGHPHPLAIPPAARFPIGLPPCVCAELPPTLHPIVCRGSSCGMSVSSWPHSTRFPALPSRHIDLSPPRVLTQGHRHRGSATLDRPASRVFQRFPFAPPPRDFQGLYLTATAGIPTPICKLPASLSAEESAPPGCQGETRQVGPGREGPSLKRRRSSVVESEYPGPPQAPPDVFGPTSPARLFRSFGEFAAPFGFCEIRDSRKLSERLRRPTSERGRKARFHSGVSG